MNTRKHRNMMSTYTGFPGCTAASAVKCGIPEELFGRLTGQELGLVMTAIDAAYHRGRASTGAEVLDASPTSGTVWINCLGRSLGWQSGPDGTLGLTATPVCGNE